MLTSTKYLGQYCVRQEFGFNIKVVVWLVSYSLQVTHLPADLPGAHKSGKQVASGEKDDLLIIAYGACCG